MPSGEGVDKSGRTLLFLKILGGSDNIGKLVLSIVGADTTESM